ncbi:hypothetical protein HPB52_005558 [Rhipicephalus sanguineus]|uniref:Uncharacterized protein n=1 Tax=Rhipicephalus sanguineus TaxID=34632 RepID=A0A9D4Q504_RHISA|nr:hypothetical protein HPB52_005558 [Rhipicephalus sanguineus]
MLSPSSPDDKQSQAAASSGGFAWLTRARNRLRTFNVLHGTSSRTSPHVAAGSPDSASDSSPCFSSAVDLRSEATEPAVTNNAPELPDLAAASRNPSSTRLFRNRIVVSDPPRPSLGESRFSKSRSVPHPKPLILVKRKLAARAGAECSSLNDLDDIDANNEKWKTFGSAYSGEQRLILLDEAAKRCPEREHAEEDSNGVCPGLTSRSSSLKTGLARQDHGALRIPHERGRHSDDMRSVSEEDEEASSPFGVLSPLGALSAIGASSEIASCSRSTKSQLPGFFEADPKRRPSKQWSSNAVADFTRDGSVSERASLREEQHLKDRIASWDPSQEDGYALSMFEELADLESQEVPLDPTQNGECPISESKCSADKSSTAVSAMPCSPCPDSASRKSSVDLNLYDDLKWLTEGSESNPKCEILFGVDEERAISWSEPSCPPDGAEILTKMAGVLDSIVSVVAFSPEQPSPGLIPEATLSTFDTETEQPLPPERGLNAESTGTQQSKTECPDNSRARGAGQTVGGLQQESASIVRSFQHNTHTTASDKDRKGRNDIPISGGNSILDPLGVAQANERNEVVKRTVNQGALKTRDRLEKCEGACANVEKHCARDDGETALPTTSTANQRETLARLMESMRLVDIPGASWDVAPMSSVKGTPLRVHEFHSDDVNVKDSGEVTVCIRTSTRRKSAMVWPFGTTSASRSPSPPQ